MIVTSNKLIAKKLKIIRNQGQNYRYNHIVLGNNYRMTDISAAIGIVQLKKLKTCLKLKEQIAKRYDKDFLNFEEIRHHLFPRM